MQVLSNLICMSYIFEHTEKILGGWICQFLTMIMFKCLILCGAFNSALFFITSLPDVSKLISKTYIHAINNQEE